MMEKTLLAEVDGKRKIRIYKAEDGKFFAEYGPYDSEVAVGVHHGISPELMQAAGFGEYIGVRMDRLTIELLEKTLAAAS